MPFSVPRNSQPPQPPSGACRFQPQKSRTLPPFRPFFYLLSNLLGKYSTLATFSCIDQGERCAVRLERAPQTLSHLSHRSHRRPPVSDQNGVSCRPPHQNFSSLKGFQVSTCYYLPYRAKTKSIGALYVESVHREVSATSATGQRLPPTRWPATEIAPADTLLQHFS